MRTSDIFAKNSAAKTRVIVNQGGSRSGKTYSILQLLILRALSGKYSGKVVSIVRKTRPSIQRSVFRDFQDILVKLNKYNESSLNKTQLTYNLNGCTFEFFSTDQPQKVRGSKRHVLFCNEANELSLEDWVQLSMRTSELMILDFNPSDEFHWIYDDVLTRDDCTFIQSTYKDNPFLPIQQVKEIERLKEIDEFYWKVYGLGERGVNKAAIWTHWKECNEIPPGRTVIGIDFGFNNPSAVVQVTERDQVLYVKELLYQSNLTTQDIIQHLKQAGVTKSTEIYADAAEPDRITEIKRAGFNCYKANKDVKKGIDTVKAHGLFIHRDSSNLLKEIKTYKWKEKDGAILDEVVKVNDHACDALRYAAISLFSRPVLEGRGMAPNPTPRRW